MAENPPTGTGGETGDNSTIRTLREAQEAAAREAADLKKQLEAATSQLAEIEKGKLSTEEQLRREIDDARAKLAEASTKAESVQQQFQQAEEASQRRYESLLNGLPEEKRETAQRITQVGTWAQRLDGLSAVIDLLPGSASGGTITRPTDSGTPPASGHLPTDGPKPLTMEELGKTSWMAAAQAHKAVSPPVAVPSLSDADIDRIAERVAAKAKPA